MLGPAHMTQGKGQRESRQSMSLTNLQKQGHREDATCSAGFSTALLSWLHVHRWLQEKNSNRSWSRHKGELGCAGIQTRLIWRAQERPGREMSRCQNQWAHQCRSLRQGEKLTGVLPTRSRISSSAWRLLRQCSKQDSSSFQLIHYAC